MHSESVVHEVRIQSSPKRMWEAFVKDAHSSFPNCEHYKGITGVEYHDGGGAKAGAVRFLRFGDASNFGHVKQRFIEVDDKNFCAKSEVLELGVHGRVYKNFVVIYEVKEGCVRTHFQYPNGPIDKIAHDEMLKETDDVIKGLDKYLLAHKDLYA